MSFRSTQRSPNLLPTKRDQSVERCVGVGPLGAKKDRRSVFGREHHDAHDALAVHIEIVLHDGDFALEFGGELHDLSRRPRMQAVLVDDLDGAFWH